MRRGWVRDGSNYLLKNAKAKYATTMSTLPITVYIFILCSLNINVDRPKPMSEIPNKICIQSFFFNFGNFSTPEPSDLTP